MIKIYRKCEKFPNGGKMTQYLETLKVGDELTISGPVGRLAYHGNGKV